MNESCGQNVAVDSVLVDKIVDYRTAQVSANDALLVARLQDGESVVALVRRQGQWHGYFVAENGGIQQLYRSSAGSVFLWAYEGQGDPPHSFTGFHVGAEPNKHFCTRVDVPDVLNQPHWMGEAFNFERFNLSESGEGAILGSAQVERDGRELDWKFHYLTSDGGRSWSDPVKSDVAQELAGIYEPIDTQDEALLAEVRAQAA